MIKKILTRIISILLYVPCVFILGGASVLSFAGDTPILASLMLTSLFMGFLGIVTMLVVSTWKDGI
jgi:hypothetical protein